MQYRKRCHGGLVSSGSNPNLGCGEWDYSCNTMLTDSSRTDSVKSTHPNYIVSGFSGTTFNYTANPTYTYYQSTQEDVNYTATNSETIGTSIGTETNSSNSPFEITNGQGKTQYLITAAELTASGLATGDLTSLKLNIDGLGDEVENLRIKLKSTSKTQLDPLSPDMDGFTTVYYLSTTFGITGLHDFKFNEYFNWDGTSNVIIEFTFDGTTGNVSSVQSSTIADHGITTIANDYALEFTGSQNAPIENPFPNVSEQITISFWSYGSSDLPQNTSIFEAVDGNNSRQLNLHLPWQNGSIYWDCGNDGGG
jgi:hypothetical protein